MGTVFRELVTGPRLWSDLETAQKVLIEVQGNRPPGAMVLVHGQCDPRHPHTKKRIRWDVALKLRRIEQSYLRGADWLCAWAAVELGWRTEPHPAEWTAPCRPTCNRGHRQRWGCPAAGDYRNDDMVQSAPDRCDGFVLPCVDQRCWRTDPHGTHGTANALALATRAGIPTFRHPDDQLELWREPA